MEFFKSYNEHLEYLVEASNVVKAVAQKYPTTLQKITSQAKVPVLSTELQATAYNEVKLMQAYLNAKGITTGTDGKYGSKTAASVKTLQKKYSLTADGIAGLKTWKVVLKELGVDASSFTAYKMNEAADEEGSGKTEAPADKDTATDKPTEAGGDAPAKEDAPAADAGTVKAKTTVASALLAKYDTVLKRIREAQAVVTLSTKNSKTVIEDAKLVQDYLTKYKMGTLTADGLYGTKSATAAKKWQKAKGLGADGVFGLKSWAALLKEFSIDAAAFKATAAAGAAAAAAPTGATLNKDILALRDTYKSFFDKVTSDKRVPLLSDKIGGTKYSYVEMFQKYLNLKGFNVGTTDGLFGGGTKAAVVAFQKANRLTSDGIVGLKSWTVFFKDFGIALDPATKLSAPTAPKAAAGDTKPTPTAPAATASTAGNWYAYSTAEQGQFAKMTFKREGGEKVLGEELLKTDELKTDKIGKIITATYNVNATKLLLKQSRALGANPIQLIMRDGTITKNTVKTIIDLGSPLLDAEMLYYGMRGVEDQKGHGSNMNIQWVLQARRGESPTYKLSIEKQFEAIAVAAKDAYSDVKNFPLRKWLYEEFKDSDPAKWMNMVTQADPQTDQQLYPQLYQK